MAQLNKSMMTKASLMLKRSEIERHREEEGDMEEEKERSEYCQSQTSKKNCPAGNPRKERAGRACEPAQNEL